MNSLGMFGRTMCIAVVLLCLTFWLAGCRSPRSTVYYDEYRRRYVPVDGFSSMISDGRNYYQVVDRTPRGVIVQRMPAFSQSTQSRSERRFGMSLLRPV